MSLPIQKARYSANAIAVAFGRSNNNNIQIAVTFEIVDSDEYNGETIAWIGHFTDATAARTIESLQHMGWQGDDLAEFEDLDEAAVRAKLPQTVELDCDAEEYEGKWHLRVRWVNRIGGRFAFKEPVKGGDLKAFAAQMRATVRGVRGAAGGRPAAPPSSPARPAPRSSNPHPNAPGQRDDIPF